MIIMGLVGWLHSCSSGVWSLILKVGLSRLPSDTCSVSGGALFLLDNVSSAAPFTALEDTSLSFRFATGSISLAFEFSVAAFTLGPLACILGCRTLTASIKPLSEIDHR